ncbi:MAG: tRNA guanosine(34) transglycosylase Tgt [Anaerolineae bacterium]
MKQLILPHGTIDLPAFLPDGTQGVVRSIDAADLRRSRVQAVQMNAYHLMQRPGSSTVRALGGLHQMAGWDGPIFTDSGGFQVYSLIRQNSQNGSISDKGATFRIESRKFNFTPEKSIQLQMSYGSDVIICLDDCTHADDDYAVQAESVRRTVAWARRCRTEFDRLVVEKQLGDRERPSLIAVIQGGRSSDLRRQCADELLEIGFDGYGYGGWPLDADGNLVTDALAYTRELVPPQFTVHALGVGHPQNVVDCAAMGYNLFDSTMPTRDARHGRLYAFSQPPSSISFQSTDWFHYVYAKDKKHIKDSQPLSSYCDCHTCTHFSLGYLHHLYKLNDNLYARLATIHNLRFMTMLLERLREQ